MHQVVYNNKLEHKCTLTPLDPRPLYIGLIQAKGYLSLRDTCPDLYSYLSILCVLCLAICDTTGHLSVLCSARQLSMRTMQCWAAFNVHYSAFRVVYIVFVLLFDQIYQNYIVFRHFEVIGLIFSIFIHSKL